MQFSFVNMDNVDFGFMTGDINVSRLLEVKWLGASAFVQASLTYNLALALRCLFCCETWFLGMATK